MPRSWMPRYFRRFHIVEHVLDALLPLDAKVADVGAGEGVLVQQLRDSGFRNVVGVDPYAPFVAEDMIRGSVFELPFESGTCDAVTCLDVLEHIPLNQQEDAAGELYRVLKPGGFIIVSVPNMAHLRSRLRFLVTGSPWRNKLKKHPGELTMRERIAVLERAGFIHAEAVGLHLPLADDPRPPGILGSLLSRAMFSPSAPASLCRTSVLLAYKEPRPEWAAGKRNILRRALATYHAAPPDPTAR